MKAARAARAAGEQQPAQPPVRSELRRVEVHDPARARQLTELLRRLLQSPPAR